MLLRRNLGFSIQGFGNAACVVGPAVNCDNGLKSTLCVSLQGPAVHHHPQVHHHHLLLNQNRPKTAANATPAHLQETIVRWPDSTLLKKSCFPATHITWLIRLHLETEDMSSFLCLFVFFYQSKSNRSTYHVIMASALTNSPAAPPLSPTSPHPQPPPT